MYLLIFIHSIYLFKILLQPYYIALSHISIRARYKISARSIKYVGTQKVRKSPNKEGLDP